MNKVYLALYKGSGGSLYDRLTDWIIRKATKGKYSHCEIAIKRHYFKSGDRCLPEVSYDCYSSSPRDGGVRCKTINVSDHLKWDLIELKDINETQIISYFEQTKGKKYDLWGALGVVLGIKHKRSKFFCSEWCFNVLKQSDQGWRFSPNQLVAIFK